MYNHKLIQEALRGLIGFESSYDSDVPIIDADLLTSSSGIYVNNLHPLLTYDNILSVAQQFSDVNVRAHSALLTYKIGDVVREGTDDIYQSLINDNLNQLPSANASKWRKTNLLSAFLRRIYDNSSIKLFQSVFTEKKLNEAAKTLLTSVHLFEGVGNITKRITPTGRFVGYKIKLKHQDVASILTRIGLQLDTPQTMPVYLYHTSSDQPLKVFSLNHTNSIRFQWHTLSEADKQTLSALDANVIGGEYYLGYYESDLENGGMAIMKEISFSGKTNCGSCSDAVRNLGLYNSWSKFVSIQPFYVTASSLPGDQSLWDADQELYTDNTTFGLNLEMTMQCDVTSVIVRNKSILADALSKQLLVDLLNEMTYSSRDNQKKQKVSGLAAVALDNQENGQEGEAKRLKSAVKALSFDLSDMSEPCMGCDNRKNSFKIKSVWT